MKKAASASKHWRLLSYLCSIRKAEVHNKLCAHGLRHLLQFFILELSCFHPLVECLRGGVHPPGKFSFFYLGVRRSGKLTGKENRPMDEKAKALKELLEILVEHPDLAERITITIKPNRIIQSNETPTDNK